MLRLRSSVLLGALGVGLLVSATPRAAASAEASTAATLYKIQSNGISRWYRVHLPPSFDVHEPYEIVLAFHGGGGNAVQFMNQSGLNDAADRHDFVVVYPEGTGVLGGAPLFRLQTWNAGACCGYAADHKIDDVQFVRDLIADLDTRMTVDHDAIFATGHSNGGMMSYRLGVEAPDLIDAIGPNACCLILNKRPQTPIPLIAFHGKLDCNVPYQGGVGCGISGVDMSSQQQTLQPFLQVNGATPPPLDLPAERRGKALRFEAPASTTGADVHYWWMLDHGHAWPGHGSAIGDPCNFDIDINDELWVFFDQHRG